MVRRKSSVHLQKPRQLVFLFDLLRPLKLRLNTVLHAIPAVILDVHIVRRCKLPPGRLGRQHCRNSSPHRALHRVIRIQHFAEPRKYRCIRAVPVIPDDQCHRLNRHLANVRRLHNMLFQAHLPQPGDTLWMLQRLVPIFRWRHENGYRLFRLDIHMIVLPRSIRTVCPSRMIIPRVQPHALVVCRQPIEKPWLLAIARPGKRPHQQNPENDPPRFVFLGISRVSHSTSIESPRIPPDKFPSRTCRLPVSCPKVQWHSQSWLCSLSFLSIYNSILMQPAFVFQTMEGGIERALTLKDFKPHRASTSLLATSTNSSPPTASPRAEPPFSPTSTASNSAPSPPSTPTTWPASPTHRPRRGHRRSRRLPIR